MGTWEADEMRYINISAETLKELQETGLGSKLKKKLNHLHSNLSLNFYPYQTQVPAFT